jgi:hypothetical protein
MPPHGPGQKIAAEPGLSCHPPYENRIDNDVYRWPELDIGVNARFK